jgi:hypothetical protein
MLELKSSLQLFLDRYGHDLPDTVGMIDDEDWPVMQDYVDSMKPFVEASKLLGGEKYPSVCAAIPLLDQVKLG